MVIMMFSAAFCYYEGRALYLVVCRFYQVFTLDHSNVTVLSGGRLLDMGIALLSVDIIAAPPRGGTGVIATEALGAIPPPSFHDMLH